ncbi:MAG: TlyA family RNA methyltransferase [Minwuia sp.]|nr:TlyA family RNA methyltransferase [Minwuia sp.]
MMEQRADQALVARGIAQSRARARALIDGGKVTVDGVVVARAAELVREDQVLALTEPDFPYVSRGALKLVAALDHFRIDPTGCRCLDLGASTGGFTDVLLRRGAAHVTAVDVGHDQLHDSLRGRDDVAVLEGQNARELTAEDVPQPVDLIVCDVSFISLTLVLPPALSRAMPGTRLVALVKPQFEAGRKALGKSGVVRSPEIRAEVLTRLTAWLAEQPGWQVLGSIESPITGPKGNVEYLLVGELAAGNVNT